MSSTYPILKNTNTDGSSPFETDWLKEIGLRTNDSRVVIIDLSGSHSYN
ncbi:hypothetical protein [Leptospira interrogans]|nr:hypothetical protein [Leptospira interrogans]